MTTWLLIVFLIGQPEPIQFSDYISLETCQLDLALLPPNEKGYCVEQPK